MRWVARGESGVRPGLAGGGWWGALSSACWAKGREGEEKAGASSSPLRRLEGAEVLRPHEATTQTARRTRLVPLDATCIFEDSAAGRMDASAAAGRCGRGVERPLLAP